MIKIIIFIVISILCVLIIVFIIMLFVPKKEKQVKLGDEDTSR